MDGWPNRRKKKDAFSGHKKKGGKKRNLPFNTTKTSGQFYQAHPPAPPPLYHGGGTCLYVRWLIHTFPLAVTYHLLKTFPFFILTDNLGPVVVYCPPDQHITATAWDTFVSWNEPQFRDNNDDNLTITCSHHSGAQFHWGTWNVYCIAYDNNPDNNPAVCQFTLTLKRK